MSVADRDHLRELASLHALGVLTPEERAELARAAAEDPDLAIEVRALEDTVGALGGVVQQVDPPAALRARVLSAITGTAGQSLAAAGVREGAGRSTGSWRASTASAQASSDAGRAGLSGWLAAAAAVVIAAGLGIYALQLRTALASVESRLVSAETEMTRLLQVVGQSEERVRVLQAQAGVLTAPDMARIDLQGQATAPGASARAFWSRRSGMTFAVNQLPTAPAGKSYQVWVVTASQPPISAGLLTLDAGGNTSQYFKTPEDVPAPVAIAVTLEPAGGVPQPTGDKVLVGLVGN